MCYMYMKNRNCSCLTSIPEHNMLMAFVIFFISLCTLFVINFALINISSINHLVKIDEILWGCYLHEGLSKLFQSLQNNNEKFKGKFVKLSLSEITWPRDLKFCMKHCPVDFCEDCANHATCAIFGSTSVKYFGAETWFCLNLYQYLHCFKLCDIVPWIFFLPKLGVI